MREHVQRHRAKHLERIRAADRERYQRDREAKLAYARERRQRQAAWLREQKGTTCSDCGETFDPAQLHWHHRDPATMSFRIARSVSRSRAKLEAEIAKCDVLCASCHAKRHGGQAGGRDAQGRWVPGGMPG